MTGIEKKTQEFESLLEVSKELSEKK